MQEVSVLDHGYVRLVRVDGVESEIIEAARMSTNKGFKGWDCQDCNGDEVITVGDKVTGEHCETCPTCKGTGEGDTKLLRYLYTHKHMTPFEMVGLVIEVQAPVFIFREWHRHRTQSYNEMSGRYTVLPDLYYIPSIERLMASRQSSTNKQSSEEGFEGTLALGVQDVIRETSEYARVSYEHMLENGVAREIARLVLPVNQYSRMRAKANLRNWLGFLTLRNDPAAQWEIQQYAAVVADMVREAFPRTYALYEEEHHE